MLVELLCRSKELYPQKTIWCYTGYTLETDLLTGSKHTDVTDRMLSCIDVLVDGRYMRELRDLTLAFRGSRNQRILDLPKTLQSGEPVWLELPKK